MTLLRLITRLDDGSRVEDIASAPISGTELIEEFAEIERLYGSRPMWVIVEGA